MLSEAARNLPLVIRDHDGRGASLDYSPTGQSPWMAYSWHNNDVEAREAYDAIPTFKHREPERYRVVCHSQDVVKEPTCNEQPTK